ncbi:isoprenylcysteine carboxylmethyltransferase family protein [Variovorax robiniae]|uniref:Isoprenylcysteine carboxylmethyltransferase family protein n=1 Tax=Variovorax robiniae TaxID=1836199 RepID=A0ABU8XH63_9BURK
MFTQTTLAGPAPAPFLVRRRIAIWRVVLGGILMVLLLTESAAPPPWLMNAMVLVAIAFVSLALVGRLWCALYISGRKGTVLVKDGPYSMSRHPLYVCNFIGMVGLGALTGSLLVLTVLVAAFAILYPAVIRAEEQGMQERFPEYAVYARSTPAFFPQVALYRTPAEWTVNVRAYLRNARDSIWFPLMTAVIEGIRHAHSIDVLPELFDLI